ncbi:MAG: hypothetical protein RSD07_10540 [Angelakisella sp.]
MENNFLHLSWEYRHCLELCRQLEEKNCFLHRRMSQLRATPDPCTRAVIPILNAQLRQLRDRIWIENNRLAAAAHALDEEITKLRDEQLMQILRCRHLELMSWNELSDCMGLSPRWLQRLHKRALAQLG